MNHRLHLKTELLSRLETFRIPVTMAISLRLALGMIAFLAYILYPQSPLGPFPDPTPDTPDKLVISDRLLTSWGNWDGGWYVRIAEQGYQPNPGAQVFFPLYPLLMRGLGKLLFGRYLLAGVIISTVMAAVVFIIFYELVRRDYDERVAERALLYLSIFPTIYYLFAAYTEATFMALVLSTFFAARHLRRWWLAGILAGLVAVTRNLGICIVIPLFIEWLLYRNQIIENETGSKVKFSDFGAWRKLLHPTIVSLGFPVVTFTGWLIFNQLVLGDAFGPFTSQLNWERHFALPWNTIVRGLQFILTPGPDGFIAIKIDWYQGRELLDFGFFLLGTIVFLYGCWKFNHGQFPLSYLLFFAFGLIMPLTAPVTFHPFLSFPRYLLALFPMFILWAQVCRRYNWLHYLTLYVWLSLLGLLFILFSNGYWVA